jgi:hypothetical protein
MKLRPEALAQRARELAISEGITIREAYKEMGRRAGNASVAKRKQRQLATQPTLPVQQGGNYSLQACYDNVGPPNASDI